MLPFYPFPLFKCHNSRLLVRRLNASILCLLRNLVYPTPHSLHLTYPLKPNCSWILCLLPHLRRRRGFWQTDSDSATGPDGNSANILKTCSAALAHSNTAVFIRQFSLRKFPSDAKHTNMVQKRILLTTGPLTCFRARCWLSG